MLYTTSRKLSVTSFTSPMTSQSPSVLTTFSGQAMLCCSMWRHVSVLLLIVCLTVVSGQRRSWEAPGCHLVGHTRLVTIPGCVPFNVTTNACRGFCLSYAIPSSPQTLAFNPNLVITSRAECCGIVDTHEVNVWVACTDGFQQKTFKSARTCVCSICRRTQ